MAYPNSILMYSPHQWLKPIHYNTAMYYKSVTKDPNAAGKI